MPVHKTNQALEVPKVIANSSLWHSLNDHPELQLGMSNLRKVAVRIAGKISAVIPWLTEHSVAAHMDRLDPTRASGQSQRCNRIHRLISSPSEPGLLSVTTPVRQSQ